MPTACPGVKRSIRKKNPVTLVRIVAARKIAAQMSSRFAVTKPHVMTNPEPIPIRLNATWSKVNVVMIRSSYPLSNCRSHTAGYTGTDPKPYTGFRDSSRHAWFGVLWLWNYSVFAEAGEEVLEH